MIKLSEPLYSEYDFDVVKEILQSGQIVNGRYTKLFEENFAKYCDRKYCVSTSNGTDALFLALKSCNVGSEDSVLVPAMTFFATIEAVLHVGAKPIFVDVDPLTWCMTYDSMKEKFNDTVKACIPVHLFGQPCSDIIEMSNFCKSTGISMIEDCAQAHGATVDGLHEHDKVGSFGKLSCFSFMATKNLACGGEGGAIVTNRPKIYEKIQKLKQHGMTDRNTHEILGYNSKMSEIECAIANLQLINLDFFNEMRIKNSMYLRDMLKVVSWLQPQIIPHGTKNVFFWCAFKVDESVLGHSTQWLREQLFEKGIETRHRYNEPLYHQPAYKNEYPNNVQFCPNAEKIAGKLIGLPNHPKLTKQDLKKIIRIVKSIDKNK